MPHIGDVHGSSLRGQATGRTVAMVSSELLPGRLAELTAGGRDLGVPDRLWAELRAAARPPSETLARLVADLDRRDVAVAASPDGAPQDGIAQAVAPYHIASRDGAPQGGAEYDEHDDFFGVTRGGAPPAAAFLASSLRIHLAVVRHQRAYRCGALSDQVVRETGWRCLLGYVRDANPRWGCAGHVDVGDTAMTNCPQPHKHWRIGHQLFFTVIQGIIVGLQCFLGEYRSGNVAAGMRGLALGTDMCHHSAVAMRFAASLDPIDYEFSVRPSMLPPAVRPGFSGLQTRDHHHLVRTLRRARPMLEQAGLDSPPVTQFARALESVYAAHHLVCARFDGSKAPSLLMEAIGGKLAARPGTQIVDQLAARRLALLRSSTAT